MPEVVVAFGRGEGVDGLSAAVTPGSEALPGNSGATFAHIASLITNPRRSSIPISPTKRGLNHSQAKPEILNVNKA